MPDKPFVINDRRKFTADGELRHDTPSAPTPEPTHETPAAEVAAEAPAVGGPRLVTAPDEVPPAEPQAEAGEESMGSAEDAADQLPALTADQIEQVKRAYDDTLDRLDTAIRSQNLGAEQPPPITFQSVVQTLFMQALMMLGGAAEPGQPVSVDPMGARQMIDMITAVVDKAKGNLSPDEEKFCESALFELRMGFLDVTQRLARQAAARAGQGMPGAPGGMAGGPSIVR
ncbi:protein of unknown function [Bryocella elongata]|uniref:DUF1844 domain-containing protein n=1 Tax=Bryocella elongata TaxID=863522 RepID=A0A1H6B7P8_9BACT|nr:DUF1844 domain-containing protein [Bryocella elongata]SEG56650.1 protein of unknown function [Bryocella elongata]